MSLSTDKFFYDTLIDDPAVMATVEGRIFNPAREDIDEEEDKIPYIIIALEDVQNVTNDKDERGEGLYDQSVISVLVVERNRDKLAVLSEQVRRDMRNAINAFDASDEARLGFGITNYTFRAGQVQFDPAKPCCFQQLVYTTEDYSL